MDRATPCGHSPMASAVHPLPWEVAPAELPPLPFGLVVTVDAEGAQIQVPAIGQLARAQPANDLAKVLAEICDGAQRLRNIDQKLRPIGASSDGMPRTPRCLLGWLLTAQLTLVVDGGVQVCDDGEPDNLLSIEMLEEEGQSKDDVARDLIGLTDFVAVTIAFFTLCGDPVWRYIDRQPEWHHVDNDHRSILHPTCPERATAILIVKCALRSMRHVSIHLAELRQYMHHLREAVDRAKVLDELKRVTWHLHDLP